VPEDVITIHSSEVRCSLCGFYANLDGAVSEDEITGISLLVEKMHARQRHNEVTSFATTMNTYETPTAPTDVVGRRERMN
jgi:hypothetical protein